METSVQRLPSKAQFAAQVSSRFDVDLDNGAPVALELVDLEEGLSSAEQEQFALVFRAPRDMPARQGTYHLEHAVLGAVDLFLVPVGREGDDVILEATFNRCADSVREQG
jgi:hypothetical protein